MGYYVNEDIRDLYRVKFHDQRGDILRLDMNENPCGLPVDFVESVKEKITPEFLATYPEKDDLIALIAEHNGVQASNVTLTAGSDEAMRLIFQCFGEAGKEVLTVSPTFEMYDVYSNMYGMEHIMVDFAEDFTVSADEIRDKITDRTGLVILLNPNSPIGTAYTREEFGEIVRAARIHGALLIVDEAYHYFYEPTFMPYGLSEENVVVLRTFSKLCSIAGLRVGYAVAHPDIIRYIENAQSTFNVNNVGILFATEILRRPEMMESLRQQEAQGHQWLARTLKDAGYATYSGHGNYVLFYPHRASGDVVSEMKKRGVWVRDYGRGVLKGWIRVSTGGIEAMQQFWKVFREVEG